MASCNLTTGFTRDCFNSAGGSNTIYIAPFSAKGNLTISSGSVTNVGSFLISQSGAQFFQYTPRVGTTEAKSTGKVNQANGTVYFEPEVDFVLTRTDVQKRNEVTILSNQSVMIIVVDNVGMTGSAWLYGSDTGMELSPTQGTGKAYGDLNGYTFKFGPGRERYDIVQVPNTLLAALTTPA